MGNLFFKRMVRKSFWKSFFGLFTLVGFILTSVNVTPSKAVESYWTCIESGDKWYAYIMENTTISGDIVVPAEIDGHEIYGIGNPNVTNQCSLFENIENTTIPNNVVDLTLEVSEGIKVVSPWLLYQTNKIKNVYLPNSVEKISANAFKETVTQTNVYCLNANVEVETPVSGSITFYGPVNSYAKAKYGNKYTSNDVQTQYVTLNAGDGTGTVDDGILMNGGYIYTGENNSSYADMCKLRALPSLEGFTFLGYYNCNEETQEETQIYDASGNLNCENARSITETTTLKA